MQLQLHAHLDVQLLIFTRAILILSFINVLCFPEPYLVKGVNVTMWLSAINSLQKQKQYGKKKKGNNLSD